MHTERKRENMALFVYSFELFLFYLCHVLKTVGHTEDRLRLSAGDAEPDDSSSEQNNIPDL